MANGTLEDLFLPGDPALGEELRRIMLRDLAEAYGPVGMATSPPSMPPYSPPPPTAPPSPRSPINVEGYRPGGSEPLGPWDERGGIERLFPDKHSPQAQWSILDRLRRGGPEMPDAGPRDIKVDFGGAPIVFGQQGLMPPHPGVQGMAAQFDPSMLLGTPFEPPAQLPAREMAVMPPERTLPPSSREAPPFEPQGPTFRRSAVSGLLPGLGEMPRGAPPPQTRGGMDDTRFRGPAGQMAPEVDLGGAVLPVGRGSPGGRTEPIAASASAEMDPDRRIALLGAARNLAKAGSQFANITGPAGIELEAQGRQRRDFSIDTSDVDAEEQRIRRGDFENPGSPASQMARQMLSQLTGQEAPESMSASAVMGISPVFDKLIRAQYAGFGQQLALEREARAQESQDITRREKLGTGEGGVAGLPVRHQTQLVSARKDFLTRNKKLIESVEQAEKGMKAVDLNTMAFFAAAVMAARASGEVGNLSQTEQQIYREVPTLEGRARAAWDWVRGEINEGRRESIKAILELHRDDSLNRLKQKADEESQNFREFAPDADPETIRGYFSRGLPGMPAGGAADRNGAAPSGAGAGAAGAGDVWVKRGDEVRGPVSRAEAERMLRDRAIDAIVD